MPLPDDSSHACVSSYVNATQTTRVKGNKHLLCLMLVPARYQDASSNAHLLLCTSKEQLRVHLRNILASTDPSLSAMQRRIQKAYLVFGEEGVCSRLHGVLAGQGAAPATGEAALTQPAAGSGKLP